MTERNGTQLSVTLLHSTQRPDNTTRYASLHHDLTSPTETTRNSTARYKADRTKPHDAPRDTTPPTVPSKSLRRQTGPHQTRQNRLHESANIW